VSTAGSSANGSNDANENTPKYAPARKRLLRDAAAMAGLESSGCDPVGDLDPTRFKERLSALDARLDALHGQDQALTLGLGANGPTTPDTATLRAVADQLDHVIAHGEPEQAKALLALLIADLRINSRAEILPTYRVATPTVCAHNSSVGRAGIEPATLGLRGPCSAG
jgi:hypothetical protein